MHRLAVAPWSNSLKVLSALSVVILVGLPWLMKRTMPAVEFTDVIVSFVAFACAVTLIGSILFVVKEYELDRNQLIVHRLWWPTRISIRGLKSVRYEPAALKGSIRVLGNGGLFSFSGLFYNRVLGFYRLYATDPQRAVVMRMAARTVVVTPANPDAFMRAVSELFTTTT